jgi:hypothetical protein
MTQTCSYKGEEFILNRDIKLGVNWGESAMKEVNIQDGIAENLRRAYESSYDAAQAA